jgi:hypothetical protein
VATLLPALLALLLGSCERRPLEDIYRETALIPVHIDWSKSGINVMNSKVTGEVHRVSIRFFPKDGSPAFDRYMESDVVDGVIDVPIGRYSVVVFNESIHDLYWSDAIAFSDVNSYADFAAAVLPFDAKLREQQFPFYRLHPGETVIVEPLKLASWSLDDFEVTEAMVIRPSRPPDLYIPVGAGPGDIDALTRVVMRALTRTASVTVHAKNLSSAQAIPAAVRGFASRVYMASARTMQTPSTHLILLNERRWDNTSQTDGIVHKSFLTFGRTPESEVYQLALDVLLVSGELYTAASPLEFNVTGQVLSSSGLTVNIRVDIDLPHVDGEINVSDWINEEIEIW